MATGRIKRWNAEQGFGFIQCDEVGQDVFAHATDFKNKNLQPSVGDEVSFDIKQTKKGLQAVKIIYPNQPKQLLLTPNSPRPRNQMRSGGGIFTTLFKLGLVLIMGFLGYQGFQKYKATQELNELSKPVYSTASPTATNAIVQTANESRKFTCDGRTRCAQMTSREEANYFVAHCPNTEMDGDHDGEACENDSRFWWVVIPTILLKFLLHFSKICYNMALFLPIWKTYEKSRTSLPCWHI